MDYLPAISGYWIWWVLAGVLLVGELMLPGVFFIWLAIAAAIVAVLDAVFDLAWQWELLAFALLSLASVFMGRAILKRRQGHDSDRPTLNQRHRGYVGRSFVLAEPIVNGRGKLAIEDTVWEVGGADQPKGARVKVTGVDGMRLLVEPA